MRVLTSGQEVLWSFCSPHFPFISAVARNGQTKYAGDSGPIILAPMQGHKAEVAQTTFTVAIYVPSDNSVAG
jgi:hypothetical protein